MSPRTLKTAALSTAVGVALSTTAFARADFDPTHSGTPLFLSTAPQGAMPEAWQQPVVLTEKRHKIRLTPVQPGDLLPLFLPTLTTAAKPGSLAAQPLYLGSRSQRVKAPRSQRQLGNPLFLPVGIGPQMPVNWSQPLFLSDAPVGAAATVLESEPPPFL